MSSTSRFAALILAYHATTISAIALPQAAAPTPPATFTANPNIGPGGPQYLDSAHFRVYNITDPAASSSLHMLETAYTCFVDTLGWRTTGLPWNASSPYSKTNIYSVADGSMPGAAGQQWTDDKAGLTFLKVVTKYMTEPGVAVHEFGHAMTYSEHTWVDQQRTGAWWETVANFVADTFKTSPLCEEVRRANGIAVGTSLIELKKVVGDSWQVLVDATSGSGNYYQAWPFLSYLTYNLDGYKGLGTNCLRDMFRLYKKGSNETPLHVLERVASPTKVQTVVGRYWARMAYVDIGHKVAQDLFFSSRKSLGLNYANLDSQGGGKYRVKAARQPRYMGANIIPLKGSGTVNATVTASIPFTATFAVRSSDGSVKYTDLVNGSGSITVGSGDEASLVVVNTPNNLILYDPFSLTSDVNAGLDYTLQLTGATA